MAIGIAAVATVAALWIPGGILRRLLRRPNRGLITLSYEFALGIAFWPLLLLLTSSCGIVWTQTSARILFAFLCLSAAAILWMRRAMPGTFRSADTLAVAIVAIVVFTRIRQVEGVAYPLWVDSVHHTMIVRLLMSAGRIPTSYAPFIPGSTFYYHWGFHADVAFIGWLAGVTSGDGVARLLLVVGQVLNVLVFFAVYAGGSALLRSRRAGLLAATLAMLVSFFPAYYVSWGRYTQLCGLLILPPLAVAFWELARHPRKGLAAEVAILSGGLLLVHVRVAIMFAMLAAVLSVVLAIQRRWRGLAWCAAAAAAGVAIAGPWLVRLESIPEVRTLLAPNAAERLHWETPNQIPDDLLWAPNNAKLFALATGGLIGFMPTKHLTIGVRIGAIAGWAALVLLLERRARRKGRRTSRGELWRLGILGGWVLGVAAVVNGERIGLPRFTPLPNSAAIITLFLPVSIAGALVASWSLMAALRARRARQALVLSTIVVAVVGASTMLHIINPRTLLVAPADREALMWISSHTSADARFAVGVQPWLGGSFIGIDGGYWIPLVTGRSSALPPGLYSWVMPAERVRVVTAALAQWSAAQQGGARVSELLRRQGLTHIYFGARNGTMIRQEAASDPSLISVYDAGGVQIYALR